MAAFPLFRVAWWRAHPVRLAVAGVVLIAAAALVWYLASPLVIRTRLDESASGAAVAGQALLRGTFSDRDAIHRGSGTATLVRTPDGKTHLRLDGFRVTNGPDLSVYLAPSAAPNSHEEVTGGGALQVGRLRAAEGTFGYELPATIDVSKFRSAIIYCFQFRTVFSV